MNSRLAFIMVALAMFFAFAFAVNSPTPASFLEQEAEAESQLLAELEAEATAEVDAENVGNANNNPATGSKVEYKAVKGNPNKPTGAAIKPALIFDDHILSGAEGKKAQKRLKTFKVEPPAAVLPPILGDVDKKILDMAYDLSFEQRPTGATEQRKKLNRGAKLLNAYAKMKKTLAWATEKPKAKKAEAKPAAAAEATKAEAKKF